jgi:hypothetical protein
MLSCIGRQMRLPGRQSERQVGRYAQPFEVLRALLTPRCAAGRRPPRQCWCSPPPARRGETSSLGTAGTGGRSPALQQGARRSSCRHSRLQSMCGIVRQSAASCTPYVLDMWLRPQLGAQVGRTPCTGNTEPAGLSGLRRSSSSPCSPTRTRPTWSGTARRPPSLG